MNPKVNEALERIAWAKKTAGQTKFIECSRCHEMRQVSVSRADWRRIEQFGHTCYVCVWELMGRNEREYAKEGE